MLLWNHSLNKKINNMKNILMVGTILCMYCSCNYTEREKKMSNIEVAPGGYTALNLPKEMQEKLVPYTKMSVEVIWPKHAELERTDIKLWKKNPELYADHQNQNVALYTRSVAYDYVSGSKVGDTVQLRYYSHVTYPQSSSLQFVCTKAPFEEYQTQEGEGTMIEYLKGVVKELN